VTGPRIAIALSGGRSGYVVAVLPPADGYHSGPVLAVGSVLRTDGDGEAETWRAWLWPAAGGAVHVTRSCAVADAEGPGVLAGKLQKRCDKDGPWWRAGDAG